MKRRPPSDKRLLRGATDPGITKAVVIAGAVLAAFAVGCVLVARGLF